MKNPGVWLSPDTGGINTRSPVGVELPKVALSSSRVN